MDSHIDKLISYAGNKGFYQWLMIILVFFLWVSCNMVYLSISYLEKMPLVNYTSKLTGIQHFNITLNQTICEDSSSIVYVKEYTNSWVTSYGIQCNKLKTSFIGFTIFFGNIAGMLLIYLLEKVCFPRLLLLFSTIGFSLSILLIPIINNYYACITLAGLSSIFATFLCLLSIVQLNEITAVSLRSFVGGILNTAFGAGGILIGLCFYLIPDWKIIFYVFSSFNLLIGLILYFLSTESPRLLLIAGKTEQFFESLLWISKFNRQEETFTSLRVKIEASNTGSSSVDIDRSNLTYNSEDEASNLHESEIEIFKEIIFSYNTLSASTEQKENMNGLTSLLKYSSQRWTFLILLFQWFTTVGIYYGITIYVKYIPGNSYFNAMFMFTSDMVTSFLMSILTNIDKFGRKVFFYLLYSLGTVSYLLLSVTSFKFHEIIFSIMGRVAINSLYTLNYIYTPEVFPTVVRNIALAFTYGCGNVSSVITPFLVEYMGIYVNIVFIALCSVSFALSFFLSETINKPLQNNIPELEHESNTPKILV